MECHIEYDGVQEQDRYAKYTVELSPDKCIDEDVAFIYRGGQLLSKEVNQQKRCPIIIKIIYKMERGNI